MAVDINLTPTGSLVEIVPQSGQSSQGHGNNQIITGRTWGTASECRSAALLVHGLGAHSGWFEALGRRLRVKQYFSLAYDQIGFGPRRHQDFFMKQQWLDDIKEAYQYLQDTVGDKPIFIMGNSMGALVAIKALAELNPAGLVMFSPGFDGHPETFRLTYRLRAIYKAFFDPDSELALPYGPNEITREPQIRQWIAADPDGRFNLSARMLLELLKLTSEVKTSMRKVPCPVMMFTSGQERIVNNQVNDLLFERIVAPRKDKHRFDEAFHDLMFDPVLDSLVDMLSTWMNEVARDKQKQLS